MAPFGYGEPEVAFEELAKLLGRWRQALVEQGFTRAEALELCKEFLRTAVMASHGGFQATPKRGD